MRYIAMREAGQADVLQVDTIESPTPGAGEVLIEVAYAGVNRPDVFQRLGAYPPPPGASPILGLEVSGTVVEVGRDVSAFAIGDSVCALTNGGAYAERVVVDAGQCLPVPKGLSMAEAAALPETCFTVWSNVFDRGGLKAGETFLVHGGASGIGTTAIQMAKGLGATVIATASSTEKCQACLKLGADLAINYHTDDYVAVIRDFTEQRGVDVVLDMVGGDYIDRNIQVAAMDGRVVSIAFLRGPKAEVNFMPVMLKRLTLTGSTLRPQSPAAKARIADDLRQHVWSLIEAGKLKPQVAKVFSLYEAAAAHQMMESNSLIGKVVLDMKAES
ncbi:NAD(P)H-quinone oxidoreductase [Aestuariicella hydrocarbonica]|uniref:NAD(P)H-quinone oxidoreductase n=1 Tax=Pseudomaricurvus hydrocarbonicus TaxID=1470433 RepID=A0A9E5JRH9_9GAMM|nr:NAD(P)H-quinone oxidoreductase [Aestuariicella hydrocarbonica]NHO64009.1 NAD(P)H-quinone oxidoreductase [Aestuariicella hydrocarbonica]